MINFITGDNELVALAPMNQEGWFGSKARWEELSKPIFPQFSFSTKDENGVISDFCFEITEAQLTKEDKLHLKLKGEAKEYWITNGTEFLKSQSPWVQAFVKKRGS